MSDTAAAAAPSRGTQPSPAHPGLRIGHVHLKVADIDRALGVWRDAIGLEVQQRLGRPGAPGAVFLSAGGYHHHIALNTWESEGGAPPPAGTTGLYHFAINYPTRRDLAAALRRLLDAGWGIDGASDHGTHEAIYLHDPDGNGIELAWDRDPSVWRRDGQPVFDRKALDFAGLLAELGDPAAARYVRQLAAYR